MRGRTSSNCYARCRTGHYTCRRVLADDWLQYLSGQVDLRQLSCYALNMEWTPGDTSSDIEDRRDSSGTGGGGSGGFGFGGGGGFGGIHLGIGGTLLLLILSFIFHINLFGIFQGGDVSYPVSTPNAGVPDKAKDAAEAPEVKFVSFILDDVQKTWTNILPAQASIDYHHAILVLYRDATNAGCGFAQSATGPFTVQKTRKSISILASSPN